MEDVIESRSLINTGAHLNMDAKKVKEAGKTWEPRGAGQADGIGLCSSQLAPTFSLAGRTRLHRWIIMGQGA